MEHCVECISGMFGATALSVLFPVGMFAVLALSLARADERRRQSLADDLRNDAMLDDTLLPTTLETARLEVRRRVALSRGAAKRVVGDSNEAPSASFRRASRCLLLKARHQSVAAESRSSPPHPPLPRPRRGTTAPASCVRRDTPLLGARVDNLTFFRCVENALLSNDVENDFIPKYHRSRTCGSSSTRRPCANAMRPSSRSNSRASSLRSNGAFSSPGARPSSSSRRPSSRRSWPSRASLVARLPHFVAVVADVVE
jgi:hypothetical protein